MEHLSDRARNFEVFNINESLDSSSNMRLCSKIVRVVPKARPYAKWALRICDTRRGHPSLPRIARIRDNDSPPTLESSKSETVKHLPTRLNKNKKCIDVNGARLRSYRMPYCYPRDHTSLRWIDYLQVRGWSCRRCRGAFVYEKNLRNLSGFQNWLSSLKSGPSANLLIAPSAQHQCNALIFI